MASFPRLKTNAVAQYPATRSMGFQNKILRFLDGNEQRYRVSSGPLNQWVIRLDRLDESEMSEIDVFFASSQGQFGSFTFVDPLDGTSYANCSLAADQLDLTSEAPMRGRTLLTIVENRA